MRYLLSVLMLIATATQAADYWPLDLNATWHFREQGGMESVQSVLDFTHSCLEPCSVRMNGLMAGEYYAGEQFIVGEDGDVYLAGLVHASDDFWIWDCYAEPALFLDLPLEVGKSWSAVTADVGIFAEVTGEEQVVTPAGEFTCLVVELVIIDTGIYIPFSRTLWLDSQIGPVKIDTAELVSYSGIVAAELISWGGVKALFR